MSQSGFLSAEGGAGGGDVLFLVGNDAIPVGPNLAGDIFLVGINGTTVTNTAANTLSISAVGAMFTVTTLDATPTAIYTVAVAPSSAVTITATIAGAKSDFTASSWSTVIYGARRAAAGAATGVEFPINPSFGTDAVPATIITSAVVGNNLEITVQGQAATTWNWTATVQTVTQT